jgi:uncharacterized membrane protein
MADRSTFTERLVNLRNLFLQGIALLAPLILTMALLVWLIGSVEIFIGGVLRTLLPPGWYVPGLGLLVGVLVTLAAGLLANLFLVRWLLTLMERVLDRIPLVKSLFQGLKDVARFFSTDRERQLGRPVRVALPMGEGQIELVGFVMQERASLPTRRGDTTNSDDASRRMAVYLPMSYQVGGYTLYLDPAQVTPLAVGTEHALRAVLTGGSLAGSPRRGRRPSDRDADEDTGHNSDNPEHPGRPTPEPSA